MAKRNPTSQPPTPMFPDVFSHYLYWLRWWEMMVASGMTIGLRLSGISYKLQKNQLPDMREMWRMGEEKNAAALQSLAALPTAASGLPIWQKQMQDAMFALWSPFYKASTANAFRLSGTRKPRQRK